jgi:hypothetical protein
MSLLLPDVSEFQSPAGGNAPNWAGIKSQNGGAAIIRVGYGNAHLDGMFVSNYTKLKQNSFSFIGLYHYLRAGQDAASQAHQFCSWVGPLSALFPGSIPMLDLEEGTGDQSGRASTWFSIVDSFYGLTSLPLSQRSWLYSGDNFARTQGLAPIFNSARRTWVASYKSFDTGLLPHSLWQSTNGVVGANRTNWSGCGFVDTSVYGGSLTQLSSLGWHPNAVPIPPDITSEESMHIDAGSKFGAVSFAGGQYSWIAFFADTGAEGGKQPQSLRVAPYSNDTHGFAGITTVTIGPDTEKVTVQLPSNCSGISFQRQDDPSNWATIAYNLGG